MNICVDIGNTATKIGVFHNSELESFIRFEGHDVEDIIKIISDTTASHCIVSSTVHLSDDYKDKLMTLNGCYVHFFDFKTPIPVRNLYQSPQTMGMDRLAAVIGAYDLKPNNDILIIDAGTAITFDILNSSGEYLGGNISPGLEMRFKALHEYTSLLPLVSDYSVKSEVGVDTISAIQNGVINGVKYEIKGVIESFVSKYPQLLIFLTGGNDFDFDTRIKKRNFVDKYLVLRGLNRVLKELIIQ